MVDLNHPGVQFWWHKLVPKEQQYVLSVVDKLHTVVLNPDKLSPAMYLFYLTFVLDNNYDLIEQTLRAAERICDNNIDLHSIYTRLAEVYYKHRGKPGNIHLCEHYCLLDLNILEEYLKAVFNFFKCNIPPIKTIYRLVILYEKEGRYQEALKICDLAIQLNLSGYDKRKERIEKKISMKRELLEG